MRAPPLRIVALALFLTLAVGQTSVNADCDVPKVAILRFEAVSVDGELVEDTSAYDEFHLSLAVWGSRDGFQLNAEVFVEHPTGEVWGFPLMGESYARAR